MRSFAREAAKLTAALARADRIAEVLTEDDVIEDRPHAYRGGRARGEIELEHVSFAVRRRARRRSRTSSIKIAAGQRLALTGPSGAGKSTLAALVARFYDPTEGRVLIDGRDARDCAQEWLRDQIAVVLQDTVLFTGTVRENIAYGSEASDAQIVDAAKAAAAHDFIQRLPDGYDTAARPAGHRALRRPAPAHRHRPHAAAQPADHHPRRAHHGARRRQRGPGHGRPRPPDARPHVHPHHPLGAARCAPPTRSSNSITDGSRRRSPLARALVTGCAGFIGSHLTEALLADGHAVLGVDCFNDNYARADKRANLARASDYDALRARDGDLVELDARALIEPCDVVFHLAGEPGVRSSWGPRFDRYTHHNVAATQRLLEAARELPGRALRVRVLVARSTATRSRCRRTRTTRRARSPPTA